MTRTILISLITSILSIGASLAIESKLYSPAKPDTTVITKVVKDEQACIQRKATRDEVRNQGFILRAQLATLAKTLSFKSQAEASSNPGVSLIDQTASQKMSKLVEQAKILPPISCKA